MYNFPFPRYQKSSITIPKLKNSNKETPTNVELKRGKIQQKFSFVLLMCISST